MTLTLSMTVTTEISNVIFNKKITIKLDKTIYKSTTLVHHVLHDSNEKERVSGERSLYMIKCSPGGAVSSQNH